ncbi:MAG: glycosyltransferase [Xanthomonadales bacterium]|nr:glycosyltransferase [Xanthomonadales bacterium]
MKVLHVDLAPIFRGGQRQALMLHRHLRQAGVDSLLAVAAGGRLQAKAMADGVEGLRPLSVRALRSTTLSRLLAWPAMWRLLRRERPDVLHFHEPASLLYRPLAGTALTVQTRRVSFPIKPSSVRLKYQPIDLHVAVSDEIAGYLRGLGLAPVHTVRSAIDNGRFQGVPDPGPIGTPLRLLYIGAFHKMKGIEVLQQAFIELAGAMNCSLDVVGDGELLAPFQAALQSAGLGERLRVHGYREDTERYLGQADVVLVPSTYGEGSNGMIKEALAAGRPVIASDLPCNGELIEHGRSGLLFRNGDAADLAARVLELAQGQWSLPPARLRAAALGWADSAMGEAYLALYERYLASR